MTELTPNMLAPNFTALTDNGALLELAKLRGQIVVLYFYPQADTPACTTQACGFRDSIAGFSSPQRRGTWH